MVAWGTSLTWAIILQLEAYITSPRLEKPQFAEQLINNYASFMPQITTFPVLYYPCIWSINLSFPVFFQKLGSGTTVKAHTYLLVVDSWVVLSLTEAGWVSCSCVDQDRSCLPHSALDQAGKVWLYLNLHRMLERQQQISRHGTCVIGLFVCCSV